MTRTSSASGPTHGITSAITAKEIRDGSVTFFVTSIEGFSMQYEYLARATHSGTFTALPAEVWAMYEPDVWGRSASDEVRIEN